MEKQLTLQVTRRDDGRFVTAVPNRADMPLGVDGDINTAIETAVREATRISREIRYSVAIEVERASGGFKREQIVNPPARMRGKASQQVTSTVDTATKATNDA